ncbi:MAG: uncharacterized protein HW419_2693 [Deltaproteobacteria bacterium]|nr:uncharacterized protein [Deltaproteobacteria bacterium]
MRAQAFWKVVAADHADFLSRAIELLTANDICYCVIGGYGVSAYVDPLVSVDLDIVIAAKQRSEIERLLGEEFTIERVPQSMIVSTQGSDLRLQLQTDPRYESFLARASVRDVLGIRLPVASLEDVLQDKIWAALDSSRRPSKRQKDLADIARLIESYPQVRENVPDEILRLLV